MTASIAATDRRTPVPGVEALSDEALFEAAVDGLRRGGENFVTDHESPSERARLARVIRARRFSLDDLRLAGVELAATDVRKVFHYGSTPGRYGHVDVSFLLIDEGAPLHALVTAGKARERRRTQAPTPAALDTPGPVRAVDPVVAAAQREVVEAATAFFSERRAAKSEGRAEDPAIAARYEAAQEALRATPTAPPALQETGSG